MDNIRKSEAIAVQKSEAKKFIEFNVWYGGTKESITKKIKKSIKKNQ